MAVWSNRGRVVSRCLAPLLVKKKLDKFRIDKTGIVDILRMSVCASMFWASLF
jgi:hypothetical protein